MDRPWRNDQLGVNKIGKNIKKSSLHHPNFSTGIAPSRPQPELQAYNISKNDFRSIVQRLKLSPSRDSLAQPLPLPQNLSKPQQNTRLQKIRPVALTQINRSHVPPPLMAQPTHELVARPPMRPYMHHSSQSMTGHGEQFLSNTAESPVSVYKHYFQSSLVDSGPNGNQIQSSHEYQSHPQGQGQAQPHQPPQSHNHHSPRFNDSARDKPILPTPRFNCPPQQMYNSSVPSPQFDGRGILPSPRSKYLVQSPTISQNFLSTRSPCPLLSPGVRYPPPRTPRSSTFSPMGQPGILGPGTIRQPPASSGLVFPSSLYGVFPISSPRWRGY